MIEEGLRREVREEAGADINAGPLTGVYKSMPRPNIALAFCCTLGSPPGRETLEALEVGWHTFSKSDRLLAPSTHRGSRMPPQPIRRQRFAPTMGSLASCSSHALKVAFNTLRVAVTRMRKMPMDIRAQLRPIQSGWALSDAERATKHRVHAQKITSRMALWNREHPVFAAALSYCIVVAATAWGFLSQRSFLPHLSPTDPRQVLSSAWQVHSGFVAIAFAGLAMLIDMAGRDSLVRAVLERQALIRHTRLYLAFAFSLMGALYLGVVSTWFATPGTVLVSILGVVAPAVLLIGTAYSRAIGALTEPTYAERTSRRLLNDQLIASMEASQALIHANLELSRSLNTTWLTSEGEQVTNLLVSPSGVRLADVHLPTIKKVAAALQKVEKVAGRISAEAAPAKSKGSARLIVNTSIGSRLESRQAVFLAVGAIEPGDAARFERMLRGAVRWEDEA